jgi:hypothetical protein
VVIGGGIVILGATRTAGKDMLRVTGEMPVVSAGGRVSS